MQAGLGREVAELARKRASAGTSTPARRRSKVEEAVAQRRASGTGFLGASDDDSSSDDGDGDGDDERTAAAAAVITRFVRMTAAIKGGRLGSAGGRGAALVAQTFSAPVIPKARGVVKRKSRLSLGAVDGVGGVQMDGYLQKQSSGRFRRWQRRWFEVDLAYLRYFSDEGQPTPRAAVSVESISSATRTGVRGAAAVLLRACLLLACCLLAVAGAVSRCWWRTHLN